MVPTPDASKPSSTALTYEDYLRLPENEGFRCEILDGDLVMTPSPGTRHQRVSRNLQRVLDRHIVEHDLGELFDAPTDVILDHTTIVIPDLLFLRNDRGGLVSGRAIEGPPDLVVEILSPATAPRDRGTKRKLYARYHVTNYWIVDAEARTLEIYELAGRRYRLAVRAGADEVVRPVLFPGLEIRLADVWAP